MASATTQGTEQASLTDYSERIAQDESCSNILTPLYLLLGLQGFVCVVVLVLCVVLVESGLERGLATISFVVCSVTLGIGVIITGDIRRVFAAVFRLKDAWVPPKERTVPKELLAFLEDFANYLRQIDSEHETFVRDSKVRHGVLEAKNKSLELQVEAAKKSKELLACQQTIQQMTNPPAKPKQESPEDALRRRTAFMETLNLQAAAKRKAGWAEHEVEDWLEHERSVYYAAERQKEKDKLEKA